MTSSSSNMVDFRNAEEPLSEDQFRELEKMIGHPLPEAFRRFLATHNGSSPDQSRFQVTWLHPAGRERGTWGTVAWFETFGLDKTVEVFPLFGDRRQGTVLQIAYDPG